MQENEVALRKFISRRMGYGARDSHIIDDIYQEVALILVQADNPEKLALPYAFTVARNFCYTYTRKNKRYVSHAEQDWIPDSRGDVASSSIALNNKFWADVDAFLTGSGIKPEKCEILRMALEYLQEGGSHDVYVQLAEQTGKSAGAQRGTCRYYLPALKSFLQGRGWDIPEIGQNAPGMGI